MNDEASSSAAPYRSPHEDGTDTFEPAPTAAELAERRKKNRQMFNRKRGDLLDELLRNLDILIYAELSVIYYMDCSFTRFLFRAFVQFMSLTPKPAMFPEHPEDRPAIGGLIASNLICFICHVYFDPPSAGEVSRGYLHGGLAMDFIGQKGPASKVHLLLLDLLVISLQLVHLAASMVRRRLKSASESTSAAQSTAAPNTTQDLDSEERGVRRSAERQDIEMQTLNPAGAADATTTSTSEEPAESSEQDSLLASTAPRTDAHIFDAFHSGQIVLADLDIWKRVKEQVQMVKNARLATAPSNQALRNELAARVLRMRMGTDALRQTL